MFCVAGLQSPSSVSFKVTPEEFGELSQRTGFRPAPYTAKYNWVMADDLDVLTLSEWKHYTRQSYELVKAKLSPKLRRDFGL